MSTARYTKPASKLRMICPDCGIPAAADNFVERVSCHRCGSEYPMWAGLFLAQHEDESKRRGQSIPGSAHHKYDKELTALGWRLRWIPLIILGIGILFFALVAIATWRGH